MRGLGNGSGPSLGCWPRYAGIRQNPGEAIVVAIVASIAKASMGAAISTAMSAALKGVTSPSFDSWLILAQAAANVSLAKRLKAAGKAAAYVQAVEAEGFDAAIRDAAAAMLALDSAAFAATKQRLRSATLARIALAAA